MGAQFLYASLASTQPDPSGPSIRKLVRTYVSIAGDVCCDCPITWLTAQFKGTLEGPFACLGLNLLEGGCEPSIIQQSVGSNCT